MKYVLSILLISIISLCQAQDSLSLNESYTVLNKDSLEHVPWTIKDFKSNSLSSKEIQTVDSLFLDYQSKTNNGDSTIQAMREIGSMNYKRQYLPVINDKNEKLIWINCFCVQGSYLPHFSENNPTKWKTEVIIVKDGGNCYFTVFLNLDTKEFTQLYVNGF